MLNYMQRLSRWPIIIWQIRGRDRRDKVTLLLSMLAAPLLSLRELQKWQDPILLRDSNVYVPGVGDFTLRAKTDDLWHVLPWRENAISDLMRSTLKPGDIFIDAGANIGVYTVLASRLVGPSGRVISIEMMPDTAGRLATHIRINRLSNVTLVQRALSDTVGKIITATVQSGKYGQATIAQDSLRFGLGDQMEVETTTLDKITQNIPYISLMKIDVEGAELTALSGAKSLLTRLGNVVYESWGWQRGDCDPVDQMLQSFGFKLRQMDGNNWLAERDSGN